MRVCSLCSRVLRRVSSHQHSTTSTRVAFSSLNNVSNTQRQWQSVCQELESFMTVLRSKTDVNGKADRVAEIDELMLDEQFWQDIPKSERVSKEHTRLQGEIAEYNRITDSFHNAKELWDLAYSEGDESIMQDCLQEMSQLLSDCEEKKLLLSLNEPNDDKGAYLAVNSGSGGLEALDFAELLFGIYYGWSKTKDSRILEYTRGEVGLQSGVLEIREPFAYGRLKSESGVHRRCRISPFGAQGGSIMQTSFAGVTVTPLSLDNNNNDDGCSNQSIIIHDRDLHIEAYRGSGPGGQHKNTTDSACRLKHLPTGITIQCIDERSFHANKQNAMQILRYKLAAMAEEQKKKEKREKYESLDSQTFGNAVRTYRFNPHFHVKDSRTGFETRQMDRLLNGQGLDDFLQASLEQRFKQQTSCESAKKITNDGQ